MMKKLVIILALINIVAWVFAFFLNEVFYINIGIYYLALDYIALCSLFTLLSMLLFFMYFLFMKAYGKNHLKSK